MEAVIIIDYTNDFIADNGALTVGKPGQIIEKNIISLVENHYQNGDFVVFATDLHEKSDKFHPESKLFPLHNLKNTPGRHFYGELQKLSEKLIDKAHFMDKRRYSAFAGTDLNIRLMERKINKIHLCGVCSDICVLHTAIDAYNLGYEIVIHENCIATFNPDGHVFALHHFKNVLGATIERE